MKWLYFTISTIITFRIRQFAILLRRRILKSFDLILLFIHHLKPFTFFLPLPTRNTILSTIHFFHPYKKQENISPTNNLSSSAYSLKIFRISLVKFSKEGSASHSRHSKIGFEWWSSFEINISGYLRLKFSLNYL